MADGYNGNSPAVTRGAVSESDAWAEVARIARRLPEGRERRDLLILAAQMQEQVGRGVHTNPGGLTWRKGTVRKFGHPSAIYTATRFGDGSWTGFTVARSVGGWSLTTETSRDGRQFREVVSEHPTADEAKAAAEGFRPNPASLVTHLAGLAANPGTVIGEVLWIVYRHREDKSYRGHAFNSADFDITDRPNGGILLTGTADRSKVVMQALPDGSLKISHREGIPIWEDGY